MTEFSADSALVTYLLDNQGSARWIVAVSGSQSAAAIQLAAGQPVMAMGGFTGGDPAPTLDQLQGYIATGALRYVLVGGGFGGGFGGPGGGPGFGGPGGGASSVTSWVTAACAAVTLDGAPATGLYDCAGAG